MLKFKSLITPSAMLAAFTLAAAPSFAQERYHGRQNPSGQESSGRSAERAQPRSEAPRSQGAAPQVESRQAAPRAQAQPQPQQPPPQQQRQVEQPRAENRRDESRPSDNRRNDNRRDQVGRAVPRPEVIVPRGSYSPRYESRGYESRGYESRGYGSRGYESRGYGSRGYESRGYGSWGYGSRSYYRPYVFRPRFSIGFGIFAGYPVPYTYIYPYPIAVYGYGAPRAWVMMTPGSSYYGGVALEITPFDADVFVDGTYAGRVQDFDGTSQPLTLTAGTHRIEVQAPGYEPMVVDVGVQSGQVIPYRGDLRPY